MSTVSAITTNMAQAFATLGIQGLGVVSPALAQAWTADPGATIKRSVEKLELESSNWVAPTAGLLTARQDLAEDARDEHRAYLHLLPQAVRNLTALYTSINIKANHVPVRFGYENLEPGYEQESLFVAGDQLPFGINTSMTIYNSNKQALEPDDVARDFVALLTVYPGLLATPRHPKTHQLVPDVSLETMIGQLERLADLGPGKTLTPQSAGPLSSSSNDALSLVVDIQQSKHKDWMVDEGKFESRLKSLIPDPTLVQQADLNLCGPAVFLHLWLKHDPVSATQYILDLWEDKKVNIGTLEREPDDELVRHDYDGLYAKFISRGKKLAPVVEWIALSSLRGSENIFFDFDGTPTEDVSGITFPSEIVHWLREARIYKDVIDETNLWFTKPVDHAVNLPLRPGDNAILLVNAKMLDKKKYVKLLPSLFPNHYIVLNSISLDPTNKKRVKLNYWSWGENLSKDILVGTFRKCYYGAILARE